jgi:ABC-2 type transport system permease protein
MAWQIFLFEIRYWLRSWMLWIFLLLVALAIFGGVSTDNIQIGVALSNTYRNAPFVIQNYYAIMGLLTLLMATAFVNSAAIRDFNHNTSQIIFSTRLKKSDFLLGRFAGATVVSIIPMLGVSLGILVAKYMPWAEPERWGPVIWSAHLKAILLFAIPNGIFMAAVLFAIAVIARNEIISFTGALVLLVGYVVGDALVQDIRHEHTAALLDPFGIRTFNLFTKYWTVAEKNSVAAGLHGLLLWNRLLWLSVALAIFAFAYWRFSFAEKKSRKKRKIEESAETAIQPGPLPKAQLTNATWPKLAESLRIHMLGMLRSTFFIVIIIAALANTIPTMVLSAGEGYGLQTLPVTYWIIDVIRGSLYLFTVIVITYYAGVLVWKDREERMDEIVDATPTPEWISYAVRIMTLIVMVTLIQAVALLAGVIVQAAHGYHRFQLGLYVGELLVHDLSLFIFLAVLAFSIHVVAPNKYIGYFAYVSYLAFVAFAWTPMNVATLLVQFPSRPNITFSDFFSDAPYRPAWNWFTLYWLFFSGLLAVATVMFWPRGKQDRWKDRNRVARLRFRGGWRTAALICCALFLATGTWIYYNTKVLNSFYGPKDNDRRLADYEKAYKRFDKQPMPRVRSVKYAIDVFPAQRNVKMEADEVIYNPYSTALNEIHFTTDRKYDASIQIPGAELSKDDTWAGYRIYRFTTPLQPGESRTIHFSVASKNHGFENELTNVEIMPNGTFLNNTVAPVIGYNSNNELQDSVKRRKYGLNEVDLMPALERNCTENCRENYLPGHSDWVDVESVISTTPDQIAIAPGSLVREWQDNGRRYFQYKLDHVGLNFYSFLSADYQVQREQWNGISLEVYYLKEHPWNVPRMMNSMKKCLDYYTKNFGPYQNKEARIIEFPRVASFAQAFPGTMPYSERIGFIANIHKPDDIDFVFYVVAHEMGHQWWAHQVVGANMEGATLLSETLAQYSALMVMEKEYGRDMMRKFLTYETDNYLRSRGRERLQEHPLLMVEANQGYIHYRKGSAVLYYLKEMIGEDAVNRALRKVIQQYAFNAPPYPTSYALEDALREQTPPQLQYLLKDLLDDITIFSNRTEEATAQKRSDGKYDVTIKVEARKFKADAKGNETEVAVDDYIDIGALAKPASGKQYGDTLYRERVRITNKQATFTFTTDSLPEKAGIDPFALLIDRVPDDNTKPVTLVAGTVASGGSHAGAH